MTKEFLADHVKHVIYCTSWIIQELLNCFRNCILWAFYTSGTLTTSVKYLIRTSYTRNKIHSYSYFVHSTSNLPIEFSDYHYILHPIISLGKTSSFSFYEIKIQSITNLVKKQGADLLHSSRIDDSVVPLLGLLLLLSFLNNSTCPIL